MVVKPLDKLIVLKLLACVLVLVLQTMTTLEPKVLTAWPTASALIAELMLIAT